MLKKFRNRLILMIMGLITVILATALIAVYVMTSLRLQSENEERLNRTEELYITNGELQFDDTVSEETQKDGQLTFNRISPGLGVYFNMLVDKDGQLVMIDSTVELSQKQYEKAAGLAWKAQDGGTVELAGREWQYSVAPAVASLITDQKQQINQQNPTYQIRFLDITDSKNVLTSLSRTLLIVGVILLLFFFFLTVFFSNYAVKPIANAWKKQQQFITDASHELKTPLSIIRTNTEVLYANKTDKIEDQIKWVNYISKGTKRMEQLVNSLLYQARVDTVDPELTFIDVEIDTLLHDVLASYEYRLSVKNISLETAFVPAIIKSEPVLLKKLIEILLDNAVKYTDKNGEVSLTLSYEKTGATITIKNSGEGITAEHLPKLFDRFYRVDESRHSENSYGLGLSIAKGIIEQLRGDILVESQPGAYTLFTIKLPKKI
ncbi:sensor histidine kinase [Enterococcus larvae]|uniref:sensor histidine kinase n=1 Tax=Enterococcus larvae TaxID=2794352 RepID=UPI001FD740A9|nr:HAMP domain-containing sensor histidine kinase [Enterococcus larvae]